MGSAPRIFVFQWKALIYGLEEVSKRFGPAYRCIAQLIMDLENRVIGTVVSASWAETDRARLSFPIIETPVRMYIFVLKKPNKVLDLITRNRVQDQIL